MKRFLTIVTSIRFRHIALVLALSAVLVFAATALTARTVAAATPKTYIVNSIADTDDGVCEARVGTTHNCTLREAIHAANTHPGADFIHFNIAGCPCSIQIGPSGLPIIRDPVDIDGYTEAGAHPNTLPVGDNAVLKIELQGGEAANGTSGLRIQSSQVYIEGLNISGFSGAGIVLMAHAGPDKIMGNFIGVGSPNGMGIVVETDSNLNLIGSRAVADRNRIEHNSQYGIIWTNTHSGTANDNAISGNYILSNGGDGITISNGMRNSVDHNVISGNQFYGIWITGRTSNRNVIAANDIGLSSTGAAMGNQQEGILVSDGANQNWIGGTTEDSRNRIAFNLGPGITIASNNSRRNAIRGNAIYNNGRLGIDLGLHGFDGVTVNDPPPDADTGPNQYQNFPELTYVSSHSNVVRGILRSAPNKTFIVEIFSNPGCASDGLRQGKSFLGFREVTTSATGERIFRFNSVAFDANRGITATATDEVGNTSEFSACVTDNSLTRTSPK